jgi:hypothetical protein
MHHPTVLALTFGSLQLLACSSGHKEGSAPTSTAGTASVDSGGSPGSVGGSTSAGAGLPSVTDINPQPDSDAGNTAPPPTDVTVIITADNAYGFGYGTDTQLLNYFGGIENATSPEIFSCPIGLGPEQYTIPAAQANVGGFVYIIGYADRQSTQGVLAKFFREGADPVFTGTGPWQVCATGMDFDPGSGGPTSDIINQEIVACNAGNMDLATTSGGWVGATAGPGGSLASGEDNTTPRGAMPIPGNEFNVACGIDPTAHWMWYDWEANRTTGSPFIWPGGTGNPIKDFMIFRLSAESIPEPPPT